MKSRERKPVVVLPKVASDSGSSLAAGVMGEAQCGCSVGASCLCLHGLHLILTQGSGATCVSLDVEAFLCVKTCAE